jgi:hypothetical protein
VRTSIMYGLISDLREDNFETVLSLQKRGVKFCSKLNRKGELER